MRRALLGLLSVGLLCLSGGAGPRGSAAQQAADWEMTLHPDGTTCYRVVVSGRPVGSCAYTGALPLTTNLAHYWRLDEASGTRADAVGVLDLTPHGPVSSAAGLRGQAASFVAFPAPDAWLESVDAYSVPSGTSFTGAAWFYPTAAGWTELVLAMQPGFTGVVWWVGLNLAVNDVDFILVDPGGLGHTLTWGRTVSLNAWHLLVWTYDADAETAAISVDGEALESQAYTLGLRTLSAPIVMGGDASGGDTMDGRLDEVGIWQPRVADATMVAALWNGGAGWSGP